MVRMLGDCRNSVIVTFSGNIIIDPSLCKISTYWATGLSYVKSDLAR